MATLVAAGVLSSKLKPSLFEQQNQLFVSRRRSKKMNHSISPVTFPFPTGLIKYLFVNFVFLYLICGFGWNRWQDYLGQPFLRLQN